MKILWYWQIINILWIPSKLMNNKQFLGHSSWRVSLLQKKNTEELLWFGACTTIFYLKYLSSVESSWRHIYLKRKKHNLKMRGMTWLSPLMKISIETPYCIAPSMWSKQSAFVLNEEKLYNLSRVVLHSMNMNYFWTKYRFYIIDSQMKVPMH